MCNLFLSTFFFFRSTAPALSFLFFFFHPSVLAGISGLHCLKTFVCADEHVCFSGIFAVFLLITQQLVFTHYFLFVRLFFFLVVAALLFDSIVSNCTTATYVHTHPFTHSFLITPPRHASLIATARFYYYYYYCLQKGRAIESIFAERTCVKYIDFCHTIK